MANGKPHSLEEAIVCGSDTYTKLRELYKTLPGNQGSIRVPATFGDAQVLVQELAERDEKKKKQKDKDSKSKKPGAITEHTFDKTGAVYGAGKEGSAFWLVVEVRLLAAVELHVPCICAP